MPHRILLLALLSLVTAACSSSVHTSKHPRLGAPNLPPTDPAQVEVLHRPPVRPFMRLGRIRATPQGGADQEQVETALRQAAASMGANAILIEHDSDAEPGGVVQAQAIAYREH
ncbi:MAG TPA: hypothetical protein VL049_20740 [Candidatus Dormibacteraeota bacterium]|nr:hypothetical protein [Candidatus Dormibacteraeota bacterium]